LFQSQLSEGRHRERATRCFPVRSNIYIRNTKGTTGALFVEAGYFVCMVKALGAYRADSLQHSCTDVLAFVWRLAMFARYLYECRNVYDIREGMPLTVVSSSCRNASSEHQESTLHFFYTDIMFFVCVYIFDKEMLVRPEPKPRRSS
jgi:hypothetical protein